jgi:hypothetical protein
VSSVSTNSRSTILDLVRTVLACIVSRITIYFHHDAFHRRTDLLMSSFASRSQQLSYDFFYYDWTGKVANSKNKAEKRK